jgi:hypothetical protein
MPNPNIAEAGRATRFKKGNVPISPGRPKKSSISEAYARIIDERLPDDIRLKLGLPKRATWADALALGQIRSAVKSKTDAAKEIGDRLEGKARQPVEISATEAFTTHVKESMERLEERRRQRLPGDKGPWPDEPVVMRGSGS